MTFTKIKAKPTARRLELILWEFESDALLSTVAWLFPPVGRPLGPCHNRGFPIKAPRGGAREANSNYNWFKRENNLILENTKVDFYFYFPLNAAVNSSFSSTLLLLPSFEIMFANFQAAWKKCFLLPLRGLLKTQIYQNTWCVIQKKKCQQRLTPARHRKVGFFFLRNST